MPTMCQALFCMTVSETQILAPKEILVRNGVGGSYKSQVKEHQNEPISLSPAFTHHLGACSFIMTSLTIGWC